MAKIADNLVLTPAAITAITDRLENRSYVERIRSNEDRRIIVISITDKGRDVLSRGGRLQRRFVERILGRLTEEDVGYLLSCS